MYNTLMIIIEMVTVFGRGNMWNSSSSSSIAFFEYRRLRWIIYQIEGFFCICDVVVGEVEVVFFLDNLVDSRRLVGRF